MKKSPLKRRTGLRKVSEKQAQADALWRMITTAQAGTLKYICQWCKTPLWDCDGHHIIKRSQGRLDKVDNCYVCHRTCHQFIHDNNVDVRQYPSLESWNRRNDDKV